MLWGHVVIQWLHVVLATLWFGGTMFMALVVAPALERGSPQAQGEVGAQIAHSTKRLFAPVGGFTILFGILNATVFGPVKSWDALWSSTYGLKVVVSVLLGIVLAAFGIIIGNKAATIAAAPAAERALIINQVRNMSVQQLFAFFVVFTLMVFMRFGM